jgi:hypothetical protein
MNISSVATGLVQRLDDADGDVVVLRPDRVDLGEAGQEVLHDLEAVVAVPVRVLAVEHLDVGAVDDLHEGVDPLVVDDGGDPAQHDDVAFAAEALDDVLAGDAAHRGLLPAT